MPHQAQAPCRVRRPPGVHEHRLGVAPPPASARARGRGRPSGASQVGARAARRPRARGAPWAPLPYTRTRLLVLAGRPGPARPPRRSAPRSRTAARAAPGPAAGGGRRARSPRRAGPSCPVRSGPWAAAAPGGRPPRRRSGPRGRRPPPARSGGGRAGPTGSAPRWTGSCRPSAWRPRTPRRRASWRPRGCAALGQRRLVGGEVPAVGGERQTGPAAFDGQPGQELLGLVGQDGGRHAQARPFPSRRPHASRARAARARRRGLKNPGLQKKIRVEAVFVWGS